LLETKRLKKLLKPVIPAIEPPTIDRSSAKGLSHVCLTTPDLLSTRNFYKQVLGFKIVHIFTNKSGEEYGLIFHLGNSTFLEFFKGELSVARQNLRHICISVEDLALLGRRLRMFGYEIQIKRGRTDLTLQAEVTDPNGLVVEFHQYDELSTLNEFSQK